MMQQIAAAAVIDSIKFDVGSCSSVGIAVNNTIREELRLLAYDDRYDDFIEELSKDIIREYRKFTNARYLAYGFKHITPEEWNKLEIQGQNSYRLEMLYCFWMANQEM